MTFRPGRGYRVGSMRERITIQEASAERDSYGQQVKTWTNKYEDRPASWMPTAGQEVIRGKSVEAGITAVFTTRFDVGVTPEMRVVHSSGVHGIAYVKQVEGRRGYMELHCKQAVA